jgi:hypothetical protein
MTKTPTLDIDEALEKYFGIVGEAKFPITCKCSAEISYITGVIMHLRREHQTYIRKNKKHA